MFRRLTASTLLLVMVLGAGGTFAAEDEPAVAGTFSLVGSLIEARVGHTATLLPDGRVLIVGGEGLGERANRPASEVWDPATASFSPAGLLAEARGGHTATLLPDGRVLILGGWDNQFDSVVLAEVWDPATASFSPAGSLAETRSGHTATLLPDGRVLIVGGSDDDLSVEVWDPATASFSPAGSLTEARENHTATLLPDGRVLVVGGAEGFFSGDLAGDLGSIDYVTRRFDSAEVWDPVTASFSPAGSLTEGRRNHTATPLPDGRVLVAGGWDDGELDSAEVWDPVTASFGPAGSLSKGRVAHTATPLPDGRVLVVGGAANPHYYDDPFASAEVWDPGTASFGPAGSLAEAREDHTATLLPDGRVLVVGGVGDDDHTSGPQPWPAQGITQLATTFAVASAEVWEPSDL